MIQYPQDESICSWTKFFKRFRFFNKRYDHFIRIDIVANSVDSNIDHCLEWLGFVESKLFILLNNISRQQEIAEIRALPHGIKNKEGHELGLMDADIAKWEYVDTYFFGFKLMNIMYQQVINLEEHIIQFCQKLDFGRMQKTSQDIRILHFHRNELPQELKNRY